MAEEKIRVQPPIAQTDRYWNVLQGERLLCFCQTHEIAWTIAEALESFLSRPIVQLSPREFPPRSHDFGEP